MSNPKLKVTRSEAIVIGREIARAFDFPLLSKCLRPDLYGIKPTEKIASLIFASESPRNENRRFPIRITWRCDNELKSRLQIAKTAYGADCSYQEFIYNSVLHECERIESKRKEALPDA